VGGLGRVRDVQLRAQIQRLQLHRVVLCEYHATVAPRRNYIQKQQKIYIYIENNADSK
jgi:hypothetical protein